MEVKEYNILSFMSNKSYQQIALNPASNGNGVLRILNKLPMDTVELSYDDDPEERKLDLINEQAAKERKKRLEQAKKDDESEEQKLDFVAKQAQINRQQRLKKITQNLSTKENTVNLPKESEVNMKLTDVNTQTKLHNPTMIDSFLNKKTPILPTNVQNDKFENNSQNKTKRNVLTIIGTGIVALAGIFIYSKYKKGKNPANIVLPKFNSAWNEELLGKTVDEHNIRHIVNEFITPIKEGKQPLNGFLVQGPESKGKSKFFDWAIEQFKNAGVEIIDTTDPKLGHSTKRSIAVIGNYLQESMAEQFKKDHKYKLFVVRDFEKIEDAWKTTAGILQGEIHESAKNCGLMVAYKGIDFDKFAPAVTRMGRVDVHIIPKPEINESVEIWKEFITSVKRHGNPHYIVKELQKTRELLAKRGDNVLRELEPYLKYEVPYLFPLPGEGIEKVQKYLTESSKILDDYQKKQHFTHFAEMVATSYHDGKINKDTYETMKSMILEQFEDEKMKGRLERYMQTVFKTAR